MGGILEKAIMHAAEGSRFSRHGEVRLHFDGVQCNGSFPRRHVKYHDFNNVHGGWLRWKKQGNKKERRKTLKTQSAYVHTV